MSDRGEGTAAAACPVCGARLAHRPGNGLCAACLVALALDAEPASSTPRGAAAPEYRLLTVLAGDECRTTYLVEEEGTRALRTMDVVRAAAVAGLTPGLFEARIEELRTLAHPSIARVIGGRMTADGDFCVVAEYVAGRALTAGWSAAGEGGADAGAAAVSVFEALCDAVAWAHDHGVVHGQLLPASVVLLARGGLVVPKLTGYGVCLHPAGVTDDISGLGHVLAVLAAAPGPARLLANTIARATGPVDRQFASVKELWESVTASTRQL